MILDGLALLFGLGRLAAVSLINGSTAVESRDFGRRASMKRLLVANAYFYENNQARLHG
jgi:hypothetical protein